MAKPVIEQDKNLNNKSNFIELFEKIKSKISTNHNTEEDEKLIEMIKEAHSEWTTAEQYFQNATDPDLIDYAIFKVESKKTKFRYLIKQAKERGINVQL